MDIPRPPKDAHRLCVQTRFNDYDMFGHVNNNSYLAYCDVAKTAFFENLIGSPLTPELFSVVLVNVNITFHAPSLPGEKLAVLTTLRHIGDTSLTLDQWVISLPAHHPSTPPKGPACPATDPVATSHTSDPATNTSNHDASTTDSSSHDTNPSGENQIKPESIKAMATSVMVSIDRTTGASTPLPDDLRARLTAIPHT